MAFLGYCGNSYAIAEGHTEGDEDSHSDPIAYPHPLRESDSVAFGDPCAKPDVNSVG